MKNTHFGHFTAGRVKEGVFLEEFAPLASHSAVCAVLCYVLCNSQGIAPTTQGYHYNPRGCLTFMLKIVIILEESFQRPKVTIIILSDF